MTEVEVKFRIPSEQDFLKVHQLFTDICTPSTSGSTSSTTAGTRQWKVIDQENKFYDSRERALNYELCEAISGRCTLNTSESTHNKAGGGWDKKRINFRLRSNKTFLQTHPDDLAKREGAIPSSFEEKSATSYFLTIKGKGDGGGTIKAGISRVAEVEVQLSPQTYEGMASTPSSITTTYANEPLIPLILEELTAEERKVGLEETGRFHNKRHVYPFEGLKIEVDETTYEFGTAYEIEVESDTPDKAKSRISELLKEKGIQFGFSGRSKFGNLRGGSIL